MCIPDEYDLSIADLFIVKKGLLYKYKQKETKHCCLFEERIEYD